MLSETRHRLITEGSSSKYPREQRTRRRPMARANGRSTAVARLSGQLPYRNIVEGKNRERTRENPELIEIFRFRQF